MSQRRTPTYFDTNELVLGEGHEPKLMPEGWRPPAADGRWSHPDAMTRGSRQAAQQPRGQLRSGSPRQVCQLRNPGTPVARASEDLAAVSHSACGGPWEHERAAQSFSDYDGFEPRESTYRRVTVPEPPVHVPPFRGANVAIAQGVHSVQPAAPTPAPLRRTLGALRRALRPIQRPRIGCCGYAPVAEHVTCILNGEGRARWDGVQRCGSVWECPTCQARIKAHRAEEITYCVESHGRERVAFLTLTVRHGLGNDLLKLRQGVADAWRATTRGAAWKRFGAAMGWWGTVRALEVTHGENGWHPHLHLLAFLERRLDRADCVTTTDEHGNAQERWLPSVELTCPAEWQECRACGARCDADARGACEACGAAAGYRARRCPGPARPSMREPGGCEECGYRGKVSAIAWLIRRWRAAVRKTLGAEHVPDEVHGVVLSPIHAVDYISKLGLELGDPGVKRGRHKGRTPLEIASDFAAGAKRDGAKWSATTRRDAGLWRTYCEGMKGARQLTWTRGTKKSFGLRERTDLELSSDEDASPTDVAIATVPVYVWRDLRDRDVHVEDLQQPGLRKAIPALTYLLEVAERHGAAGFNNALLRVACGEVT